VVAESVLVKQQLLVLNRSRHRSPNLRVRDRVVAGLCTLLMRPGRLIRSAIVLKPSTLLSLHRAPKNRVPESRVMHILQDDQACCPVVSARPWQCSGV